MPSGVLARISEGKNEGEDGEEIGWSVRTDIEREGNGVGVQSKVKKRWWSGRGIEHVAVQANGVGAVCLCRCQIRG